MKKIALLLALVLCLSLCACGGNDKDNEGQEVENQQTNNSTENITITASNINAAYVGEWKANHPIDSGGTCETYTITFNSDGTAAYNNEVGTWKYSESEKKIFLTAGTRYIILNIMEEDGKVILYSEQYLDTYYRSEEFIERTSETVSNINTAYVGEWKANVKSSDEYYVYTITLNADGSGSYRHKYDGTWEYSQDDNWIVLKTAAGNIILNIAEEDGKTVLKYFSDTYYRADEFIEKTSE